MNLLGRANQGLAIWLYRLFRSRPKFEKTNKLIIELDEGISQADCSELDVAISVAAQTPQVEWVNAADVANITGLAANMEWLVDRSPAHYIFLSDHRPHDRRVALRYLGIPFKCISPKLLTSPAVVPLIDDRNIKGDFLGVKHIIYCAPTENTQLRAVLGAYRQARRHFPDVVLLVSHASVEVIQELDDTLLVSGLDDSSKRKLADVIVDTEGYFKDDWARIAGVTILFSRSPRLDETALHVVNSGGAAVVFQPKMIKESALTQMDAIGSVWVVKTEPLLAAAITQALSPHEAALNTLQAIERLTPAQDAVHVIIDELLKMD